MHLRSSRNVCLCLGHLLKLKCFGWHHNYRLGNTHTMRCTHTTFISLSLFSPHSVKYCFLEHISLSSWCTRMQTHTHLRCWVINLWSSMNSKLNSRADQKHAASLAFTEHVCVCVFLEHSDADVGQKSSQWNGDSQPRVWVCVAQNVKGKVCICRFVCLSVIDLWFSSLCILAYCVSVCVLQ